MKGNKGITLIALVITIIVLLILAGVSIAMLSGDNSILSRSNQAGRETAIATAKEKVTLAVNEAMTEYYAKVNVDNDSTANLVTLIDTKLYALNNLEENGTKIEYKKTTESTDPGTLTIKYNNTSVETGTVNTTSGVFNWTTSTTQSGG